MKVHPQNAFLLVLVSLAGFSGLSAQDASNSSATALIVGQVVDAESGKPVSGATVAINAARAPRGEASSERWVPTRLTGADGYFVYRNLRAGSYDLQAQKPGYASGGWAAGAPTDQRSRSR